MVVQDDARQNQLLYLFNLEKVPGAGRGDTDAQLVLPENLIIPFELKSTTDEKGSVTTARDVGREHIKKWRGKHWLIGVYEKEKISLKYSLYGSPQQMAAWIEDLETYTAPDFALASKMPDLITLETLYEILGKRDVYDLRDAQRLHKRQMSIDEYKARMDLPDGYSQNRMLEILRDRGRYLIERGATLNNPHIPGSYFSGWEKITTEPAKRLRELVAAALDDAAQKAEQSASETDRAK